MNELLSHPLVTGGALAYWRIGEIAESRFDVQDQPMRGEMDPFFFLTKEKNIIPHEYPCRTQFAAGCRDRRPQVEGEFRPARNWLPFGSPRLDLSGFWFRPTYLAVWAETVIRAEAAGRARLRLRTCGGAVLFVNGVEAGWTAPYRRNAESAAEFAVDLRAGENEIRVFFDDLAERDARYYLQIDYLEGPAGEAGIPAACGADLARAIEGILAEMRFERPSYTSGEVALHFSAPAPADLAAACRVEGDFMSHQKLDLTARLPKGATRLALARVEDLPGDFRHFALTLSLGGFSASRVFAVEVCDLAAQAAVPPDLDSRLAEALDWVAEKAEPDTVAALARLALGRGGARTEAMIAQTLPAIEDCWDCADFALVPLLWGRSRFGDLLSEALRARIDAAILGYRYWMDESGNDVQWYFSENHALLFHTSAYLAGSLLREGRFRRSGRIGAAQSAVGRERVRAWLDHFEASEMAEFNSAPYFPIDLKGLTALFALAPDAEIRERAGKAVLRLLEQVANSAHHGVLTAAQGRSYEHTLRAGRTLELSAITRLLWGAGNLGARFHALPGLALALRDHGLKAPEALASRAVWTSAAEQEWSFAQGENRFAALHHVKSRAWALGSAARYRWFDWGYQETLIHGRIGTDPDAQIWINHPGETIHSGYGRPSYWGGSASVPRCQQYRGLAFVLFDGQPEQPDFTHAWFPTPVFSAVRLEARRAAALSGSGAMVLTAGGPLELVSSGPTAECELRLAGRRGWWVLRLGETADFDGFAARFGGLTLEGAEDPRGLLEISDPEYGLVRFHPDGRVEAEGRVLDPRDWTTAGLRRETLPA